MSKSDCDSDRQLQPGKIPPQLLTQLVQQLPVVDPQVLVGPGVGEDAAVIDLGSELTQLLVVKSDPITFATDEIGHYAVHVCVNDLAVTGAQPRFYLPTVLLPPEGADPDLLQSIFAQIGAACRSLDIVVVGGHSEITPAVNQPVVAGTLLGVAGRENYVTSRGCRIGDLILLAGTVPVEGTSIIAREKRDELIRRAWRQADIDEAANYLFSPGISVLVPARLALESGSVSAMHDPTEGGVVTGLAEMAAAAGVGMEVDLEHISVPPLAQRLCAEFGLDPLGTIASGALLATILPSAAHDLLRAWAAAGIQGSVIGRVTAREDGLVARIGGEPGAFPTFEVDEITRLWAE